jgi:hypothetical protein
MLRRTISTSMGIADDKAARNLNERPLAPIETLDGFGHLGSPSASALPLRPADFDVSTPGPQHPPGFYGDGGERRAFNLFKFETQLRGLQDMPQGIRTAEFGLRQATELKYPLMTWAVMLALFDLIASLFLRGLVSIPRLRRAGAMRALLAVAIAATVIAGFVGVSLAGIPGLILFSVIDGAAMGGAAVGTMRFFRKPPAATASAVLPSFIPSVSATTVMPLTTIPF